MYENDATVQCLHEPRFYFKHSQSETRDRLATLNVSNGVQNLSNILLKVGMAVSHL